MHTCTGTSTCGSCNLNHWTLTVGDWGLLHTWQVSSVFVWPQCTLRFRKLVNSTKSYIEKWIQHNWTGFCKLFPLLISTKPDCRFSPRGLPVSCIMALINVFYRKMCSFRPSKTTFALNIALDFNQLVCGRPGPNIPLNLPSSHFVCVSMCLLPC